MANTRDPYETLGVKRDATQDEIRAAYRKLAKQNHPDLHPGDAAAESRFKEIASANDLVSDPERRAKFDRGEIDAEGHERGPDPSWYRAQADGPDGARYASAAGYEDFSDLFSEMFGQRGRAGGEMPFAGQDVSYTLSVSFVEAAVGAKKRVTMPDGKTLDITIPEGLRDRQMLRLRGQGLPGVNGGPQGDAYVEIHIDSHALFERRDSDIRMELPISLNEAVLGARVEVPTVRGPVAMTIPKGANTGMTLRLKGQGIRSGGAAGDQYVKLKVVLPDEPDAALESFVKEWAATHSYDPRKQMGA